MDQEPAHADPDPWHDPDFTCRQAVWRKSGRGSSTAGGTGHDPGARQWSRWFRARIMAVALVLLALWVGLLFDPLVGPLILAVLMAFGLTLAVMVGTMGLAMMGSGLFAAGDQILAWLRRGTRWPEE